MKRFDTDVAVIGSGGAGLMAAMAAQPLSLYLHRFPHRNSHQTQDDLGQGAGGWHGSDYNRKGSSTPVPVSGPQTDREEGANSWGQVLTAEGELAMACVLAVVLATGGGAAVHWSKCYVQSYGYCFLFPTISRAMYGATLRTNQKILNTPRNKYKAALTVSKGM